MAELISRSIRRHKKLLNSLEFYILLFEVEGSTKQFNRNNLVPENTEYSMSLKDIFRRIVHTFVADCMYEIELYLGVSMEDMRLVFVLNC